VVDSIGAPVASQKTSPAGYSEAKAVSVANFARWGRSGVVVLRRRLGVGCTMPTIPPLISKWVVIHSVGVLAVSQ